MNKMIPKMLFCLLVFTLSCAHQSGERMPKVKEPTLTIDQLIEGWPEMIESIKSESTKIAGLNGRKFNLRVKLDGAWNLNISPARAFRIEQGSGESYFTVTVVNPYILFETQGGLSKMTYVQAELSKAGGAQGAIELNSRTECLYRVRFFQAGGGMIDFNELSTAYDYDFLISPSGSLSIHSMSPHAVLFARPQSSMKEATVQVQLTSKNKQEVYLSNPVLIPRCLHPAHQEEMALPERPGLCVRHLQTLGERWESSGDGRFEIQEVFGNNCDRAVVCTLHARYGLLKDQKILTAKDEHKTVTIPAQGFAEVDMSTTLDYEGEFSSKLYLGSYLSSEATPIGYEASQFKPLECRFDGPEI